MYQNLVPASISKMFYDDESDSACSFFKFIHIFIQRNDEVKIKVQFGENIDKSARVGKHPKWLIKKQMTIFK